jgi:hypothetical protein
LKRERQYNNRKNRIRYGNLSEDAWNNSEEKHKIRSKRAKINNIDEDIVRQSILVVK